MLVNLSEIEIKCLRNIELCYPLETCKIHVISYLIYLISIAKLCSMNEFKKRKKKIMNEIDKNAKKGREVSPPT